LGERSAAHQTRQAYRRDGELGRLGSIGGSTMRHRQRHQFASRLCDEAKAGQILISQRIFGLVEPLIEASHVGDLSLKGFHRPMPTYEVLRWRAS
jgi:hypothetical protein